MGSGERGTRVCNVQLRRVHRARGARVNACVRRPRLKTSVQNCQVPVTMRDWMASWAGFLADIVFRDASFKTLVSAFSVFFFITTHTRLYAPVFRWLSS